MQSGFVGPETLRRQLPEQAGVAWATNQATSAAAQHADEDGDDALHASGRRLRTVFISDIHLGTAGCQAKALLTFLKAHPSERLYLVGDIIDGWQLRRKWYWPQSHNDVVQKILRRARKGCKVIFVPGNHDEFARHFIGHQFGGVEVVEDAVHQTADGKKLWVIHGDHFDGVIQYARWLAYLADNLYDLALRLNTRFNSLRARLGMPYWSLSQYLKYSVKGAVKYIQQFERAVAAEARKRGFDGVVCGHIHHAEIRDIDGTLYCNDGDWVESLTALVEHHDGQLEIVHWPQRTGQRMAPETPTQAVPDKLSA
ncbi:MAG: UDP-2,3-diacylglucosamine diphosphatase [Pseudomonadota bacterium]|jgi:UDP-2,3-diacylglucosamine pyrophosphatase LpxH